MLHIIKKLFSPILIITILSNFIVINEVKGSNFGIGTQENPASSCLEIKEKNPSAQDGAYWIKFRGIKNIAKYYCDMSSGSQLLFQRRGGASYRNTESSGTNLDSFLHAGPVGSADNLGFSESFNQDDVRLFIDNTEKKRI